MVYLVVFGSFALFIVYLFALKRWTASDMSYQFVLTPLVAVPCPPWLEAEPLTWGLALGGALVVAGVYTGALMRPRSARKAIPRN